MKSCSTTSSYPFYTEIDRYRNQILFVKSLVFIFVKMARILMVDFAALIAMSVCSVAYAQNPTVSPTIDPTGTPTVSPTISRYGAGVPFDGDYITGPPLPQSLNSASQYFDSARGNWVIVDPQSYNPLNYASGNAENAYKVGNAPGPITSIPITSIPYLNYARGNAENAYKVGNSPGPITSIPYLNYARGDADRSLPAFETFIPSPVGGIATPVGSYPPYYNSARGNLGGGVWGGASPDVSIAGYYAGLPSP